jgi:hypothetical protein
MYHISDASSLLFPLPNGLQLHPLQGADCGPNGLHFPLTGLLLTLNEFQFAAEILEANNSLLEWSLQSFDVTGCFIDFGCRGEDDVAKSRKKRLAPVGADA